MTDSAVEKASTSGTKIAHGDIRQPWNVVARVVFPQAGNEDTLRLYVEHDLRTTAGRDEEAVWETRVASAVETHAKDVHSRRSTKIRAGSRLSFATYFNAFPASYWRRWTGGCPGSVG